MTTFEDGPLKGQRLMLKRAPIFLRAVQTPKATYDALDQVDDEPSADEVCYAYQLKEKPGMCHIRAARGGGGFYPISTYVFIAEQPSQEQMRGCAWINWVEAHKNIAIVKP